MASHWCKVASNLDTHPKVRKAGRLGREVFLFALRRNAEPSNPVAGMLPADELEPWYVADMLQMSCDEAVTGVTAAVTAGLLVREGAAYVIVAWKDGWGKDNGSGKDRTAKWRENKKLDKSDNRGDTRDVTNVTRDGGDIDKTRLDHIQSGANAPTPPKPPKEKRPKKQLVPVSPGWEPRAEEILKAKELGVSCDAEAERFRNHHISKGNTFANVDAAFRNWLSKAVEYGGNRQGSLPTQQPLRKIEEL